MHTEKEMSFSLSFFWGGKYFTALKGVRGCGADLPPVQVLLVEDLQDVSAAEAQPRLLAGNQVVVRRVVVKVALHKGLTWGKKERECARVSAGTIQYES